MHRLLLSGLLLVGALAAVPAEASPRAHVPVVAVAYSFVPTIAAVPSGAGVAWTSAGLGHTITTADSIADALAGRGNDPTNSDGDPDTFREELPRGETLPTVRHRFASPGTYVYFCEYHAVAGMLGVVEVAGP